MNKYDKDIIKTLNVLSYLKSQKENMGDNDPFLEIKKEFLDNENLTIGSFITSIKSLVIEKYIFQSLIFFDKEVAKKIDNIFKKEDKNKIQFYNEMLYKKVEENKEKILKEIIEKFFSNKKILLNNIDNITINKKDFLDRIKHFQTKQFDINIIGYILLNEFKDIDKLLLDMNNGKVFRDIHKLKLGLSPLGEQLFIKNNKFSIKQANSYGQVLKYIFEHEKEKEYDFSEIPLSNNNNHKAVYKSCKNFNNRISKQTNGKVNNFFILTIHTIRINPKYL